MASVPISVLASATLQRVEENPAAPIFWNLQTEAYTAVIEACNDLLLLIGRPTQTVQLPLTILPNQWFQPLPSGILCITDIYGLNGPVYKYTQFDMDFAQISWGADWENDVGNTIDQWWPLGFNAFGVHPSVAEPQQVTMTAITYPTTDPWPYTGNEIVPFSDEFFSALEKYAASYLRLKEGGDEWSGSIDLYKQYLAQAQRMSAIQDRRDPYIFSESIGAQTGVKKTTQR